MTVSIVVKLILSKISNSKLKYIFYNIVTLSSILTDVLSTSSTNAMILLTIMFL